MYISPEERFTKASKISKKTIETVTIRMIKKYLNKDIYIPEERQKVIYNPRSIIIV